VGWNVERVGEGISKEGGISRKKRTDDVPGGKAIVKEKKEFVRGSRNATRGGWESARKEGSMADGLKKRDVGHCGGKRGGKSRLSNDCVSWDFIIRRLPRKGGNSVEILAEKRTRSVVKGAKSEKATALRRKTERRERGGRLREAEKNGRGQSRRRGARQGFKKRGRP